LAIQLVMVARSIAANQRVTAIDEARLYHKLKDWTWYDPGAESEPVERNGP